MNSLESYETDDGAIHVVGTGHTPTVLRVLAERAERHRGPAPTGVVDADLTRRWVRRITTNDGVAFQPCSPQHLDAELMTSWKPPTKEQKEVRSGCDVTPRTETGTTS